MCKIHRVKELGSDDISTPMEDEELMVASENIKIVAEIDNASNQATKRSRAKEVPFNYLCIIRIICEHRLIN